MAKKGREIESKRELSDLIHGNWEAAHHAIGSLLPATMYALSTKVMDAQDLTLSTGEAVATGLAGSFVLRYTDMLVDFLVPSMQRESYTRKNQRETVRTAARATATIVAGTVLSYLTDTPFVYTALLTAASFITGKKAGEEIPEMNHRTTLPASALLFASCLYMSIPPLASSTTLVRENIMNETKREQRFVEPEIIYESKPPFTIWPVVSDQKLVNSCFGDRGKRKEDSVVSRYHRGIDIQASWHTPVLSVGNGIVSEVVQRGGLVQINHGDGIFTEYGHLDKIIVSIGDNVQGGEEIGLSGGTSDGKNGPSTGPHLHFMVIDEGVSPYLQDRTGDAVQLNGKVNALCYLDDDLEFTVSKKGSCKTQGGKYKYCGLYKGPQDVVLDIEEKYGEIVRKYVDPKKLDPGLLYALIAQESRGELEAGSKTGAYGPMQFTPATAFAYELCDNKKCRGRDDRTNPDISIPAGIAYYERLQEDFKDYMDRDLFAIAAYNAGSELIRRAIENTEWSDPTWDQVAVMITQDLVGDVYGTNNITVREKKALEIKDHVNNIRGYYSFYLAVREQNATRHGTENKDTDVKQQ